MKSRKIKISVPAVFLICALSAAALPFNSSLSESDLAALEAGEVLIKNIDKYDNMSIESGNAGAVKIREEIRSLRPNYLAEVIQVRPYEGNEDLPERMAAALLNISEYAGIPYWSERHERYYDLYSSAEIVSRTQISDTETEISADLYMEPFGMIHSPIRLERTDSYLLYVSSNSNDLKLEEKFTCVKENNMKSAILLFRDGDSWILYGAGGVRAMKIAFIEKRVRTSFINRIKTFCNFIFTKL